MNHVQGAAYMVQSPSAGSFYAKFILHLLIFHQLWAQPLAADSVMQHYDDEAWPVQYLMYIKQSIVEM